MASAATFPKLRLAPRFRTYSQFQTGDGCNRPTHAHGWLISTGRSLRHTFLPVSAVRSGRGSSVAQEEEKTGLSLDNFKTTVVSRDDENINLRIDLPGKATQKVFDEALTSLARDAPPVPGFRRSKGGKTSNIPSSILLAMLGKSRVTKFILQEILSVTVGDFVKKENLKVNPEIATTQSEGDLESSFTPGSSFRFNVILQLEKESDSDEASEEVQVDSDEASGEVQADSDVATEEDPSS
ncbi:uncharacterized protein LOC100837766 isoform X2 [Brachypodium distachyon]|uniref:peptidylprolyl isomerase n=1 Tax=Brachypodium distachyon TaxID=15368 RepID=I1HU72_BRADI|nr:uncharacterized protein LOC100837766 isoform X2 [Brachypodium distachyon]KQK11001.1 hypothetical protein BRADI_2g57530v3 [Brachypodium distachyon]|eukprot:XP_014753680.1 uncharacterized protein LOC100837766 isoform X2 [Brachypodium distachyon]